MTRIELVIETDDVDVIEVALDPITEIARAIREATQHLDVTVSLEVDGSDEWSTTHIEPSTDITTGDTP